MDAPTCTPNIGPGQRRRRRVAGLWALAFGGLLAAACSALGVGALGRIALAPVFLGGFLGVIQAREST